VVALSAALPAVMAAQQPVTLGGVFHTVWVDPRNAPAPDPLYFLSGAHGVVRLELSAAELARAGGRQALERRRVTVSGLLDAPAPAPGQAMAIGRLSALRVSDIRAEHALIDAAPQSGSRTYATILCRFSDAANPLPGARTRYEAIMGASAPGLDHYWRELSEDVLDL